jgi:hypothetical protein
MVRTPRRRQLRFHRQSIVKLIQLSHIESRTHLHYIFEMLHKLDPIGIVSIQFRILLRDSHPVNFYCVDARITDSGILSDSVRI